MNKDLHRHLFLLNAKELPNQLETGVEIKPLNRTDIVMFIKANLLIMLDDATQRLRKVQDA